MSARNSRIKTIFYYIIRKNDDTISVFPKRMDVQDRLYQLEETEAFHFDGMIIAHESNDCIETMKILFRTAHRVINLFYFFNF
jgi:hypothetical protein